MDQDLESKQFFLRSEILEKGFDGEEFFQFLISKKGDEGGDLNNWTMFDLKIAVSEFQVSHKSQTEPVPLPSQPSLDQQNYQYPQFEQVPLDNNQGFNQNQNVAPVPENQSTLPTLSTIQEAENRSGDVVEIECNPPEQTELSKYDAINISLAFPEKTAEHTGLIGLFSKSIYISYLIQTSPLNLRVRRRYTDFVWLRKTLTVMFPGVYIPPIPIKPLNEKSSDKKIEKRMRSLEKFLNALLTDPLLKNSSLLYQFISLEKESDFEKIKQALANLQTPPTLSKYYTRSGKIIIDKALMKDPTVFESIKTNFTTNQTELTKLKKSYKMLFREMKQVSNRMVEIADTYSRIYKASITNSENDNLIKSYAAMEKLMKDWGYTELKQAMNIELEVREYFKYVNLEYYSIKELYDNYDYSKTLYFKSKDKLEQRKEELFKRGDISRWELSPNDKFDFTNKPLAISKMLPKDTAKLENLKMFFFYHANACRNEFNRIREVIGYQNQETFKLFYNKNSKVIAELNKAWEIFRGN